MEVSVRTTRSSRRQQAALALASESPPQSDKRLSTSSAEGTSQARKRRRGLTTSASTSTLDEKDATASSTVVQDTGGENYAGDDVNELAGDGFDDGVVNRVASPNESDAESLAMAVEVAQVKSRLDTVEGLLDTTVKELMTIKASRDAQQIRVGDGGNFIKINVGGTVFTTRKSTLMRVDGTYLAAIASGRFDDERDADGNIYIDRDPKYFQYILNWYRDPSAPQEWPEDQKGLLHELMFFGIKEEVVKGSIYVAYGFDGIGRLNTIECYNPMIRTWSKVAEFKYELSSPACAEMGGKMYITGGKNAKNRAVPTVAYFDPFHKEITVTTDLQTARFGHGLVMLDDYIYAVGGYGDDGGRVSLVERYSDKKREWESVPALLNVRSALGCDALRGKIYVAGGYGPGTTTNQLVASVEMYDPKVKMWVTVAPLKTPRAHVCCVTYQGKLWAVGGYDGHQASQVVEIYDPDLNKWVDGPSLRRKRSVVVCTVLGDTLYAIGGYDGSHYLACAEMYDPERQLWVTGPEMQVARGRHCVCTLPF